MAVLEITYEEWDRMYDQTLKNGHREEASFKGGA